MVYINNHCTRLLDQLDEWNIDYKTKNVVEDPQYLKELQDEGFYGTPVTFINDNAILGYQKNKIKQKLGIGSRF